MKRPLYVFSAALVAVAGALAFHSVHNVSAIVPLTMTTVTSSVTLSSGSDWTLTETCPTGYSVTGGGWYVEYPENLNGVNAPPAIERSYPNGNAWTVMGHYQAAVTIDVYAQCGSTL